jgi:hypothetical protein
MKCDVFLTKVDLRDILHNIAMLIIKTYKYHLSPTKRQALALTQTLTLAMTAHRYPFCKTVMDGDPNAAINILDKSLLHISFLKPWFFISFD